MTASELMWSESALADLAALGGWIGRDAPAMADWMSERILESVERALPFPRMGRAVAELGDESVRELLYRSLRIIYRVDEGRIAVLAIVHGGVAAERRERRRWEVG